MEEGYTVVAGLVVPVLLLDKYSIGACGGKKRGVRNG